MSGPVKEYQVHEYLLEAGDSPFRKWLENLPVVIQARIQARLARFEKGNLGDAKMFWQTYLTRGKS